MKKVKANIRFKDKQHGDEWRKQGDIFEVSDERAWQLTQTKYNDKIFFCLHISPLASIIAYPMGQKKPCFPSFGNFLCFLPIPFEQTKRRPPEYRRTPFRLEQETGIEPAGTSLGSWRHTIRRLLHCIYYFTILPRILQTKSAHLR